MVEPVSLHIHVYNGIAVMYDDNWSRPDGVFQSDACIQGCGGFIESYLYNYCLFLFKNNFDLLFDVCVCNFA